MQITKIILLKYFTLPAILIVSLPGYSQFLLSGQLRTRTELRDGQATLTPKGADPAFFTSQRTRVTMKYAAERFLMYSAVQDVRVWGQDASTINRITTEGRNGIMVHEAWAEIQLLDTTSVIDNLSLKIGRQELLYDDSRLLGNLDWLQQGRRHDAALLKFSENKWQADAGFAFNQNDELTSGNIYNGVPTPNTYPAGTNSIGTLYKTMQFLYVSKKSTGGYCSFLFFKDDFNRYHMDTTARILDKGVWSRFTTGLNYSDRVSKKISVFASAFMQKGKNKDGRDLSAWFVSLNSSYKLTDKFVVTLGADWLSGNNGTKASNADNRFDPLYGTPHKFWGYMDYFYVASPFGVNGLEDYYAKLKYMPSGRLTLTLDAHQFRAANHVIDETGQTQNRYLGTEMDFIAVYTLTKEITAEAGYCAMVATNTMASPQVKNVGNADKYASWVYLMLNIKTDFLKAVK